MRFMVIERFKEGSAEQIYRRFAAEGRMMPAGLRYRDSWVSADIQTCFQLVATDDANLLAAWTRRWDDLIEFEIFPVIPSGEARAKALAHG